MILLEMPKLETVDDAITMLQRAIAIEFGTLPPYLYALYTIRPGENEVAAQLIKSVAMQEMIHMCLACNILNALGGTPTIDPPSYPGPLPGGLKRDGKPLWVNLDPFSPSAMALAMEIEEPEDGAIPFPEARVAMAVGETTYKTIGQFYMALDGFLAGLPAPAWRANRNQISDTQFMAGNIFAVNDYADAHRAIGDIVSEGEGSKKSPLDFQGDVAHFYKFQEIAKNQVLTKADNPLGFAWGAPLGVDWGPGGVYNAIANPRDHDFKSDPVPARTAQANCDKAFASVVNELRLAFSGQPGRLGNAVRAMFDLRTAAHAAMHAPLANNQQVSGPSFVYHADLATGGAP